ncbi:hypothetical protein XF_0763 [Xylella fastidiosa 9a5c]|uniref:Uncharacterized protein n=1 Tax=Xylella fastidiosa (strain 9a5c) TaxID=160492 RepID=Q9PFB5_XYLFA|nr:hypothetical protein XF_0763 [Xylella fastidiosa 9a5c]
MAHTTCARSQAHSLKKDKQRIPSHQNISTHNQCLQCHPAPPEQYQKPHFHELHIDQQHRQYLERGVFTASNQRTNTSVKNMHRQIQYASNTLSPADK